jgi:hypothetical protein
VENVPQVQPGEKTRTTAARKAGFGNETTYRQARAVTVNGAPELVEAMALVISLNVQQRDMTAGQRPSWRHGHCRLSRLPRSRGQNPALMGPHLAAPASFGGGAGASGL